MELKPIVFETCGVISALLLLSIGTSGCGDDSPGRPDATAEADATPSDAASCQPVDSMGRPVSLMDTFERHTQSVGDGAEEYISYIDEGSGDPVVFIHGAPTSSTVWRNIIPHVTDTHRAIAIDLVGFGDSGSPPSAAFRYPEHQGWVTNFIDALGLENITLVVHDIGSIPGLHYAANNPGKINAIVSFEAVYFALPSEDLLPPQAMFIRSPEGQAAILEDNWFIEEMMPGFIERLWCDEEKAHYARPWENKDRRRALQVVPLDLPIAGEPADNQATFDAFGAYMMTSTVPKLLIHADPGVLVQDVVPPGFPASVLEIVSGFPNTTVVSVGDGLHFLQEDHPTEVGEAISNFLDGLP